MELDWAGMCKQLRGGLKVIVRISTIEARPSLVVCEVICL